MISDIFNDYVAELVLDSARQQLNCTFSLTRQSFFLYMEEILHNDQQNQGDPNDESLPSQFIRFRGLRTREVQNR